MIVSTCIPVTADELAATGWRTSTRSQGAGSNCVELGPVPDGTERVAVRDSKDRDGGVFVFAAPAWASFLSAVKTNTLHH